MDVHRQQLLDSVVGIPLLGVMKPVVVALGALLRREHEIVPRGDILIIKMLGGGSLVMAVPALLGLRRAHPGRRLWLLTTPSVAQFARVLGVFEKVETIETSSLARLVGTSLRAWWRVFRIDTVVDLEVYSKLTTVFSALTCARNRLGFYLESALWRRRMHTHLVFFNSNGPRHEFYDRILGLLSAGGACGVDDVRDHLRQGRAAAPPRGSIAVGVGCSQLSPERRLAPQQWQEVLRGRMARDIGLGQASFVFLGAADDASLAGEVMARFREVAPGAQLENACGTLSLGESVDRLAAAREYWGLDSGLLHLARAVGVPTVSFWGPTSPHVLLKSSPSQDDEVHYAGIPCSPCVHLTESPPCGGRNLCITALFRPLTPAESREVVPVMLG